MRNPPLVASSRRRHRTLLWRFWIECPYRTAKKTAKPRKSWEFAGISGRVQRMPSRQVDADKEPTVPCPYCKPEIHEDSPRCPLPFRGGRAAVPQTVVDDHWGVGLPVRRVSLDRRVRSTLDRSLASSIAIGRSVLTRVSICTKEHKAPSDRRMLHFPYAPSARSP